MGIHALLDLYTILGYDRMAAAFRAILPLHPRYGEALTAEAQQKFVDQAPAGREGLVAETAARVGI